MPYLPDENVKWIVVHYSATPIELDYACADIDKMHVARGFNGVGYHFFIRKSGLTEEGRDLTQPGRFEQGAHSKGENDESIGICYEGGVTIDDIHTGKDTRTPAQTKALIELIDRLQKRFPNAEVRGHRDMPGASTQCPGFNVGRWWAEVQAERRTKPHWLAQLIATIAKAFGGK